MKELMNRHEPKVSEEITTSTIETQTKSVETKKRILRNTWRGCAVQVNCYDSEGRLQSTETDHYTYQDLDNEHYQWTHRDQPPNIPPPDYAKQVEPFSENRLQTSTQINKDGSVLMVKSTETASTPVVHWTGENTLRFLSQADGKDFKKQVDDFRGKALVPAGKGGTGPYVPPEIYASDPPLHAGDLVVSHTVDSGPATREIEYKTKESMDGKKWSRTKETLWIAKDQYINPNLAIANLASRNGMSLPKGPVMESAGGLSVEDRRKMRREASRAMYAIVGKDF